MGSRELVAICAGCGYQWNLGASDSIGGAANAESTFWMVCPLCDANMIHLRDDEKQEKMGDEYDGLPWY